MESLVRFKKSLRMPIRKLASCVTEAKERRGGNVSRKTPSLRGAKPKDPSVLRSYQADLEKERKVREATNAEKNAQRAAMRAHFRRKYQLAEVCENLKRFTHNFHSCGDALRVMVM
uniref:Uncharacterized protein n=1 Tax=Nothobranchius furzeri TaxID=105023 RepID=A0A8C6NR88_NOTFU